MTKTYTVIWFEANGKHAWTLVYLYEQQEHAFLGSALHFIQITWFTYVFGNIRRVPKWIQLAWCSLDLAIYQFHLMFLRLFEWFLIKKASKYAKYAFMT